MLSAKGFLNVITKCYYHLQIGEKMPFLFLKTHSNAVMFSSAKYTMKVLMGIQLTLNE